MTAPNDAADIEDRRPSLGPLDPLAPRTGPFIGLDAEGLAHRAVYEAFKLVRLGHVKVRCWLDLDAEGLREDALAWARYGLARGRLAFDDRRLPPDASAADARAKAADFLYVVALNKVRDFLRGPESHPLLLGVRVGVDRADWKSQRATSAADDAPAMSLDGEGGEEEEEVAEPTDPRGIQKWRRVDRQAAALYDPTGFSVSEPPFVDLLDEDGEPAAWIGRGTWVSADGNGGARVDWMREHPGDLDERHESLSQLIDTATLVHKRWPVIVEGIATLQSAEAWSRRKNPGARAEPVVDRWPQRALADATGLTPSIIATAEKALPAFIQLVTWVYLAAEGSNPGALGRRTLEEAGIPLPDMAERTRRKAAERRAAEDGGLDAFRLAIIRYVRTSPSKRPPALPWP